MPDPSTVSAMVAVHLAALPTSNQKAVALSPPAAAAFATPPTKSLHPSTTATVAVLLGMPVSAKCVPVSQCNAALLLGRLLHLHPSVPRVNTLYQALDQPRFPMHPAIALEPLLPFPTDAELWSWRLLPCHPLHQCAVSLIATPTSPIPSRLPPRLL